MKNSHQRGSIVQLIIIIIAILAIGGGAYVYTKNSSKAPVIVNTDNSVSSTTPISSSTTPISTPSPTLSPSPSINFKTYIDTHYGYQIQYPSNFKFTTTDTGDNPTTSFQINYPTSYFTGTNLSDARITVETRSATEVSCYSGDSAGNTYIGKGIEKGKPALVTINTIQFHAAYLADAATGHNYDYSYLNTFHNGTCYLIVLGAQSFKQNFYDDTQPQSKVADYNPETQLFPMFMKIAGTFKFTSAVSRIGNLTGRAIITAVQNQYCHEPAKAEDHSLSIYQGNNLIKKVNFNADGTFNIPLAAGKYMIYGDMQAPMKVVSPDMWASVLPREITMIDGSATFLNLSASYSCNAI